MLQLLMVADDFTGALDAGVQFSKKGLRTIVTTNSHYLESSDLTSEVIVIDSESRYLPFEEAYQKMMGILQKAKQLKIPYIYKKVDSALRGNVAAELKAIVDSGVAEMIPFSPAYPDMSRTVEHGKLMIDGYPVSESVFAEDPYEPVLESDIRSRLKNEAGLEVHLVTDVTQALPESGIVLFDGQTNEDLEQQVRQLSNMNRLAVSVGCAGLAKFIASQLVHQSVLDPGRIQAPLIVVCGSVNPITQKQVAYAEQKGAVRMTLHADSLLQEGYWRSQAGQSLVKQYEEAIRHHDVIIFETFHPETTQALDESGHDWKEIRFKIGESLGRLTEHLLQRYPEATFLFTGGDTLFRSMTVLGVHELEPVDELDKGVVLAKLKYGDGTVNTITKSGGFGPPSLLIELQKKLQKEQDK